MPKLLWFLQNNKQLQDSVRKNEASFGTVDAFLLQRLKRGTSSDDVETLMDVTNAIATGLYDPFTMSWAGWAINLFKIERKLLPKVRFKEILSSDLIQDPVRSKLRPGFELKIQEDQFKSSSRLVTNSTN